MNVALYVESYGNVLFEADGKQALHRVIRSDLLFVDFPFCSSPVSPKRLIFLQELPMQTQDISDNPIISDKCFCLDDFIELKDFDDSDVRTQLVPGCMLSYFEPTYLVDRGLPVYTLKVFTYYGKRGDSYFWKNLTEFETSHDNLISSMMDGFTWLSTCNNSPTAKLHSLDFDSELKLPEWRKS